MEAYCDSWADFNFLFMKRTPERFGGINMREQSEDVFKLFSKIAAATGGIAETTQNPGDGDPGRRPDRGDVLSADLHAGAGRESRRVQADDVRVKGKNYKILSRQGYIAD